MICQIQSRSWACVLALTLWLAFTACGAPCTVRVADMTVGRGQTNALSVLLEAQGDENALGFSLGFDTNVLTLLKVVRGSGAASATWYVNTNQVARGRLGLSFALPPEETFAPGPNLLALLTFRAAPGLTSATTTVAFADQPIAREVVDAEVNDLNASYANGTVAILGVCTYSLAATDVSFGTAGGAGAVSVTTGSGCAWSAVNTNDWITLLSGTNLTGPASVPYVVAGNGNGSQRTGVVWIANQSYTVRQAAAPCSFVLSPTNRLHGPNGEAGVVSVTTSNWCDWTVVNTNTWLIIKLYTNGLGSDIVRYAVDANPAHLARTGTLVIGGQPFVVTQLESPCAYAFLPTQRLHGAEAGTGTVSVLTMAECSWTVGNTNPWITILSVTNGSGFQILSYSVAASLSAVDRIGVVTIGGQPFTITQLGSPCSAVVAPAGQAFGYGAAAGTVSVTLSGGCVTNAWRVDNPNDWITVLSPLAGSHSTGSGAVSYSVASNTRDLARTGTVMIADQPFVVRQSGAPCLYGLSPLTRAHGEEAETGLVVVSASSFCTWTVSNTNSWISILSDTSAAGPGYVAYALAPNPGPARRGTLLIAGLTFGLDQAGRVRVVSLGDMVVPCGQTNCLPLVLEAHGTESALSASLCYDTNLLTFISARPGDGLKGASLSVEASLAPVGQVGLALTLPKDQPISAGRQTVVEVCFRGAVVAGITATPVAICDQPVGPQVLDANAQSLPLSCSGGTVRVVGNCSVAQAVDAVDLVWTTGGGMPWLCQTAVTHDGLEAAQSGAIAGTQTTWMETTVNGPGTVSFYWKVSSETNHDFLRFSLGGLEQERVSGEVDWRGRSFSLPAGSQALRWTYTKDGSGSGGLDRAWLDEVRFIPSPPAITSQPLSQDADAGATVRFTVTAASASPLTYQWQWNSVNLSDGGPVRGTTTATLTLSNVQPVQAGNYAVVVRDASRSLTSSNAVLTVTPLLPLPEALDTPDWFWATGGSAPWVGQKSVTQDGVDAARSGPIAPAQTTWMQTMVTGPATVSFWWKVSSAADQDWLRFYVSGVEWAAISGEVDWQRQSLELPAGPQVLRWSYSKTSSGPSGLDRAWVDEVQATAGLGPLAPVITRQPLSQQVAPGANVTLTVQAMATPPLAYQWRFNGIDLMDSEQVSGTRDPILSLAEVQPAQSGDYTVVVRNAYGLDISSNTALLVVVPPSLAAAVDSDYTNWVWMAGGYSAWTGQTRLARDGWDAAQSGALPHNQTNWMGVVLLGPGAVNFWWKVSSETNHDFLRFCVNGVEQAAISGERDWQWRTFDVFEGPQFLQWIYTKDGVGSAGQDRGWVDQVQVGPSSPIISQQPVGLCADTGATVTFRVEVTNTSPINERWQFNRTDLTNGGGVSGATASHLVLSNVQPAQAGAYAVTVDSPAGRVFSFDAPLQVLPGRPMAEALNTTNWTSALTTPANTNGVWSSGWVTGGDANWFAQSGTTHDGRNALQSGVIPTNASTSFETTVSGPGTLSFWWRVSSQPTNDQLRFYLGGLEQAFIYGKVGWEQRLFVVPAGPQVLRWLYKTTKQGPGGQNCGWVDEVQYVPAFPPVITNQPVAQVAEEGDTVTFTVAAASTVPLTYQWRWNGSALADGARVQGATTATLTLSNVQPAQAGSYWVVVSNLAGGVVSSSAFLGVLPQLPLADALNTPAWSWTTGGSAPWLGLRRVNKDGVSAARSGTIADSQTTYLETTLTGPGTLGFWWKVSSESGKDYLQFYVNGSRKTRISGEVDWEWRTYQLSSGRQVVRWVYGKSGSAFRGQDRAWLDMVSFSTAKALAAGAISSSVPAPVFASLQRAGSHRVVLTWQVAPDKSYRVFYKENLAEAEWKPVPGQMVVSGPLAAQEDEVGEAAQRFYRVMEE
jgi:hypothetical protein